MGMGLSTATIERVALVLALRSDWLLLLPLGRRRLTHSAWRGEGVTFMALMAAWLLVSGREPGWGTRTEGPPCPHPACQEDYLGSSSPGWRVVGDMAGGQWQEDQ